MLESFRNPISPKISPKQGLFVLGAMFLMNCAMFVNNMLRCRVLEATILWLVGTIIFISIIYLEVMVFYPDHIKKKEE